MWGFSRETQKISFSVLSKDDLKAIHWATLDVLERTGVKVYSDNCLNILEEAGCGVDYKDHIPDLTDRRSYEAWLEDGAKNVVKKAKERAKTILEKHQVEPLEKDVRREIRGIIRKTGKNLASI